MQIHTIIVSRPSRELKIKEDQSFYKQEAFTRDHKRYLYFHKHSRTRELALAIFCIMHDKSDNKSVSRG